MIEHCIAAFQLYNEEKLFRVYITDALKAIADNTTVFLVPGVGQIDCGTRILKRWIELEDNAKKEVKKEDPRSCGEIVEDMWKRIRGDG